MPFSFELDTSDNKNKTNEKSEKLEKEYGSDTHKIFVKDINVKEANVYIRDFDDGKNIDQLFNSLRELPNKSKVNLFISSPGGLVWELTNFKNILINEKCFEVTTYLNRGCSCGAMIFTFGDKRVVYEDSLIMFHTFAGGIGYDINHIKDSDLANKVVEKFITKAMEPFFSKKEIELLHDGKEFWFDAEEMLKRNIATHILVKGELIEAKDYLKTKTTKTTKTAKPKENK